LLLAALGGAPLALAVWALARARGARRGWLLMVVAPGAAVALFVTDALYRPHTATYVIIALGFGAAVAAMVAAVTLLRPRLAGLVLLIGGAGAFAGELLATTLDREMQDLLALLATCAVVAALRPLRRRLLQARAGLLLLLLAAASGAALLVVRHVDGWTPGWRPLSWQYAHWEPRLGRALRALITRRRTITTASTPTATAPSSRSTPATRIAACFHPPARPPRPRGPSTWWCSSPSTACVSTPLRRR
jgi:hypothetical protein